MAIKIVINENYIEFIDQLIGSIIFKEEPEIFEKEFFTKSIDNLIIKGKEYKEKIDFLKGLLNKKEIFSWLYKWNNTIINDDNVKAHNDIKAQYIFEKENYKRINEPNEIELKAKTKIF